MDTPNASFRPSYFTQLVNHLHGFAEGQRREIAELYGAPSPEASHIARFWVESPAEVLKVVRRELDSSVGWQMVEETAIDHDLPVFLDWAPTRVRHQVARLGLVQSQTDDAGHILGTMPGALAAIFSEHIRGQRGSLPILLGRFTRDDVRQLADRWDLETEGSKLELILRIGDYFSREEMIDDVLQRLTDPDWIGDALMVLELGGISHWEGIYGYDFDDNDNGPGADVVPLMRRSERRRQRDVAETLLEMGVLFRIEDDEHDTSMIAVPEALWPGLWQLGRRWLMDWVVQATAGLEDTGRPAADAVEQPGLRGVLKWWACETERSSLQVGTAREEPLTSESLDRLDAVYDGERSLDWDTVWNLGRQLRILDVEPDGAVGPNREARQLLDAGEPEFVRESLLEWCLGYLGRECDRKLPQALGLDDQWRNRAVGLMRRNGEPIPAWIQHPGVESDATGAGWLRPTGTGADEMITFEYGLAAGLVSLAKVMWLDVLSLLEPMSVPIDQLAVLMQNVSGVAMFTQLRIVLEEQPAPVYLPFQRASFLMDERQHAPIAEWIEHLMVGLLHPLGVATYDASSRQVRLVPRLLRIGDPPGWPEGQRAQLLEEMFGDEVDFEVPSGDESTLREVSTVSDDAEATASIDEPLARLVELSANRAICSFDGQFLQFE